jgi:hypothetical protein
VWRGETLSGIENPLQFIIILVAIALANIWYRLHLLVPSFCPPRAPYLLLSARALWDFFYVYAVCACVSRWFSLVLQSEWQAVHPNAPMKLKKHKKTTKEKATAGKQENKENNKSDKKKRV